MSEPGQPSQKPFDARLRETGERWSQQMEDELRRAVRFIDDEVVPEVRRNSSTALRSIAERLRSLAEHLDDERRRRERGGS